jgi:hypothetical protein
MSQASAAAVVLEGEYRASDRQRAYRIVKNGERLIVESERDKDALGNVVWEGDNQLNAQGGVGQAVLKALAVKAGL